MAQSDDVAYVLLLLPILACQEGAVTSMSVVVLLVLRSLTSQG